MKLMRGLYVGQLIFLMSFSVMAQTTFREGTITYKADTVKRTEEFPAGLVVSKLIVYKKQDLIRIEVWRANAGHKAVVQKDIPGLTQS